MAETLQFELADGETKEFDVTLPEPVSMSIRLVDEEGKPTARVPVGPWYMRAGGAPFRYGGNSTDKDGRFALSDFMPGVRSGFNMGAFSGYTQFEHEGVIGERGEICPERTFVLVKLQGKVKGIVLDSKGIPVKNQKFFALTQYDDGKRAVQLGTTDNSGHFAWVVGRSGKSFTLELRSSGGPIQYSWTSESLETARDGIIDLGKITLQ